MLLSQLNIHTTNDDSERVGHTKVIRDHGSHSYDGSDQHFTLLRTRQGNVIVRPRTCRSEYGKVLGIGGGS